jgi:hypothetical protein
MHSVGETKKKLMRVIIRDEKWEENLYPYVYQRRQTDLPQQGLSIPQERVELYIQHWKTDPPMANIDGSFTPERRGQPLGRRRYPRPPKRTSL